MPTFNILKTNQVQKTFKVAKVMADFDVKEEHSNEKFVGKIDYPEKWQIGMIVGGSGTGKTTIARQLYGKVVDETFEYDDKSVIDNMPINDVEEIQRMFYAVGFGSVPSWLKPYHVLSNGEKMRVDLARKMLSSDLVVFDEYTSVVDRQVAKVMSKAIRKMMKKYPNKKFIAIGCHFDVIEHLQPDWLFDTNEMKQVFQLAHVQKANFISEDVKGKNGQNLGVIII